MKSARTSTLILMLLAAVTVFVQAEDRAYLNAKVPFGFTVGNTDLPAGYYVVSLLPVNGTIQILDKVSGKSALVMTQHGQELNPSAQSKLVFHRVGNRYFLMQVWEQGNSDYRALRPGKLESELAKGQKMATTTILASAAHQN